MSDDKINEMIKILEWKMRDTLELDRTPHILARMFGLITEKVRVLEGHPFGKRSSEYYFTQLELSDETVMRMLTISRQNSRYLSTIDYICEGCGYMARYGNKVEPSVVKDNIDWIFDEIAPYVIKFTKSEK